MKAQTLEIEPKKWPSQERSQRTFDAIVEACTRLLRQQGYHALTTNHIAETAGVGIASVYEYFPGKDAIVAQVATALVTRVMTRLQKRMGDILDAPPPDAVHTWIDQVYRTLKDEKALVAVFAYEVPYTSRLPAKRNLTSMLMQFSQTAATRAGAPIRESRADLHLLINLVSSSILQMILDPPQDVTVDEMVAALSAQVERWISQPSAS
jgi:AcrR family transcriptional regulator